MAMRLRFTIRDLLWLTLVVAMAAGWWADHRQFEPSEPIKVDLPTLDLIYLRKFTRRLNKPKSLNGLTHQLLPAAWGANDASSYQRRLHHPQRMREKPRNSCPT